MISNLVKVSPTGFRMLVYKHLHTTCRVDSVTQSPLYKLRHKTGLAYNLCREALNKHGNNVEEAEAWLKAQAMAHGLQKATKIRDRSAREGLVGLAVHQENKLATILELNCETDFVARNQIFKDLTIDLTERFAMMKDRCEVHRIPAQEYLEELRPTEDMLNKVNNEILPLISKLGENIKLQRALHYRVTDTGTRIFGQIHARAGHRDSNNLDIAIGRFGATVTLKSKSFDSNWKTLVSAGNRLCTHIIGYSPTYIELPDNIRKHLEELHEQRLNSAKTNECEQDGGEEQDYSDQEENNTAQNSRDDWPSVMDQFLIMSDDTTVRDFCKANDMSIVHFNRFECGEALT